MTDAAGNASLASNIVTGKIDTTALNVPVVTTTTSSTNNSKPTIAGTAEANSTVTVYDGATAVGTVKASSTGAWSFTPSAALTQAAHVITAKATDAAGNISPASTAITLTVDTTAPTAPVINSVSAISGTLKPTLSGTAEANSLVTIYDGTTSLGTATTGSNGSWSYTQASALSQASHVLTVKVADAAGNVSVASSGVTVSTTALDATNASTTTTLIGSVSADTITGGSGNDTITGGAGADTLKGNAGTNTYVYTTGSDSLATAADTILDIKSTDLFKIGHTVQASNFKSATVTGTGNLATDLGTALAGQAQNFIQNSAALVSISGTASDAGTYVVVANHANATAGFVAASDTVVKLQNYQNNAVTAASFIA